MKVEIKISQWGKQKQNHDCLCFSKGTKIEYITKLTLRTILTLSNKSTGILGHKTNSKIDKLGLTF